MIDEHERFEQAFELFPMPELSFDRLLRRRDRKRRNQRIAAAIVGVAVFAPIALAIVIAMGSEPGPGRPDARCGAEQVRGYPRLDRLSERFGDHGRRPGEPTRHRRSRAL